jgi:hypothetical protein
VLYVVVERVSRVGPAKILNKELNNGFLGWSWKFFWKTRNDPVAYTSLIFPGGLISQ